MHIFDRVFFVRLLILSPWLLAPFVMYHSNTNGPTTCQICQRADEARAKALLNRSSETLHSCKFCTPQSIEK